MSYLEGEVVNRRIIINVVIKEIISHKKHKYKTLIDTGATITTVSNKIVQELNLINIDDTQINTPSRQSKAIECIFMLEIQMSHGKNVEMPVYGLGLKENLQGEIDALIGMDIIEKGSLKINENGKFKLKL